MSNRFFSLVFVILILLFVNVWLAYRYNQIKEELLALTERQDQLIEENKRIITALSVLRSPQVVIPRAQRRYRFDLLDQEQIIQVEDPTQLPESSE